MISSFQRGSFNNYHYKWHAYCLYLSKLENSVSDKRKSHLKCVVIDDKTLV